MYQARRKHILGMGFRETFDNSDSGGGDFGGEVDPSDPDIVSDRVGPQPPNRRPSGGSSNSTLIYGGVGLLVAIALFSGRRR